MHINIPHTLKFCQELLSNKKFEEANNLYQNLILQFPESHEIFHAYGLALIAQSKLKEAIEKFHQAIRLNQKNSNYHSDLGEIYRRIGMIDKAIKYNLRSIELNNQSDSAHYNLGLSYYDKNNFDNAIIHFKKTIDINPNHNFAWNNLGTAYEKQENLLLAHKAYHKAVDLNSNNIEALNNLAASYTQLNNTEEAIKIFNTAININPYFFEAHFNLSSLKKYTQDDPHFLFLTQIPQQKKKFTTFQAIRYHFACGKALDDIEDYDNAFKHFSLGNNLQSSLTPYNQLAYDTFVKKTINTFNINFIKRFKSENSINKSEQTPIFIIGMPRSGTSLIEQILASHKNVYGAGELKALSECIEQNLEKFGKHKMLDQIVDSKPTFFTDIRNNYIKKVWELSPSSEYISDKMPGNFFYLGYIYLTFPNAKVIHSMRDPMDSCFSNFCRLFKDDMRFSYSQKAIGHFYKSYQIIMKHWEKVLPNNFICHLQYEDVIEDVEKEAKRLISFLGLDWDPNCLKFYDNKRPVKTASIIQVRKPIYKTSVAKWRNYAKYLKPLYNVIKSYRSPDIFMENL